MFKNRLEAGYQLANKLYHYKNKKNTIILAIPRGGIEVAYPISKSLNLPLKAIIAKKIGHPENEEYAIGAVAGKNDYILNQKAINKYGIAKEYIKKEIARIGNLIAKRYKKYNSLDVFSKIKNKNIIIVDDGIATGSTIIISLRLIKKYKPRKIILAIPIATLDTINSLKKDFNDLICLLKPKNFSAIGQFYDDFIQVTDKKVISYLNKCKT